MNLGKSDREIEAFEVCQDWDELDEWKVFKFICKHGLFKSFIV